MRDLDLFRFEAKGEDLVVSEVSDKDGWKHVKETLVKSVGMGSIPSICVEDADHNHNRTLLLLHNHDGRDLQLEYAEKTLAYVQRLWGHDVVLESVVNGKRTLLTDGERGFSAKAVAARSATGRARAARPRTRPARSRRARRASSSSARWPPSPAARRALRRPRVPR
jgi:hypothetical protein